MGEIVGLRASRYPDAPAHVTGPALLEWNRVAAVLSDRGDLDEAVLGTLESYCIQYGNWRAAAAHIDEFGPVVTEPRTGVPMANPHIAILNTSAALMLRLARGLRVLP